MPTPPTPRSVLRPGIARTATYTSNYLLPGPGVAKLNHNEADADVPAELKEEVFERLRAAPWHRYPDPFQSELKAGLAEATGHPAEGILVTNSGNEAIRQVLLALDPAARVVTCPPTYYVYHRLCAWMGLDERRVQLTGDGFATDLDGILAAARPPCALLVASPNNPTGTLLGEAALDRLLVEFPGVILLDEAYFDYSGVTAVDRLARHDNLLLVRTFSKAYGVAGARLGFLLGDPAWIAAIDKLTTPYTVDLFSQVVGTVLLSHPEPVAERAERVRTERERLRAAIDTLPGLRSLPSAGNFFLVRTDPSLGTPAEVLAFLADRGIVLRDPSRLPLLSDCFRVTVGAPGENDRVAAALAELAGA